MPADSESGHENRIHPATDFELVLKLGQRHEHCAHVCLLRLEREFAQVGGRDNRTNRQTKRPAEIVLPAVHRLQWDVRRTLHADEDRAAGRRAKLLRQRGAEERLAVVRSCDRADAVELPEPVVDAVDTHLPRAAPTFLSGGKPGDDDKRGGTAESRREDFRGPQLASKRLAEEPCGDDGLVRAPEALHDEVPKAPADRVADQERPGQHGDRRGHAGDDRQVRPPVVEQAANDQISGTHGRHAARPCAGLGGTVSVYLSHTLTRSSLASAGTATRSAPARGRAAIDAPPTYGSPST